MITKYSRLKTNRDETVAKLAEIILEGVKARYKHILNPGQEFEKAVLAAVLIPIFKMRFFTCLNQFVDVSETTIKEMLARREHLEIPRSALEQLENRRRDVSFFQFDEYDLAEVEIEGRHIFITKIF